MKKAHYRPDSNDYSIKAATNGSVYIKPLDKGLIITCHPNVEAAVTALFGEPTGRESENSLDYAKWEIVK